MKLKILAMLLALLLVLAGCTTNQPASAPKSAVSASLEVENQDYSDGTLLVQNVFLDSPGFIVVHRITPEDKHGPIAGKSGVLNGAHANIEIALDSGLSDDELVVMLHYDDGDGVYTDKSVDVPTTAGGVEVERQIRLVRAGGENAPDENDPVPVSLPPLLGMLSVTVKDPTGALLENAVVEVFVDNQKIASARTNAEGVATLNDLPRGEEWYLSAGDAENAFQAVPGEIEEPKAENAITLQLLARSPDPEPSLAPEAVLITLESDDVGLYKDGAKVSTLSVPSGTLVNLTIKQRTANSAWGGADVKSAAFEAFNVPNGQEKTVSFKVDNEVLVETFWPASHVKKSQIVFGVN